MVPVAAMTAPPPELDQLPYLVGRAHAVADTVRADQILAPGEHERGGTAGAVVLGGLAPALRVEPGDFLVAGRDFGIGAATRDTARSLRLAGVAAVLARTFGETFFRCAVHVGLPALQIEETGAIKSGDRLRVDVEGRKVVNLSSGDRYVIRNVSDDVLHILRAGGWMEFVAATRGRM
jgi:3-isopropylmalate/(R)-2-methylmalate dehydratase small subunit